MVEHFGKTFGESLSYSYYNYSFSGICRKVVLGWVAVILWLLGVEGGWRNGINANLENIFLKGFLTLNQWIKQPVTRRKINLKLPQ